MSEPKEVEVVVESKVVDQDPGQGTAPDEVIETTIVEPTPEVETAKSQDEVITTEMTAWDEIEGSALAYAQVRPMPTHPVVLSLNV